MPTGKYKKSKVSAWLICISFLLGAAFFTGYTGKTGRCLHTTQTFLKDIGKNSVVTRNVAYQKIAATSGRIINFNTTDAYAPALFNVQQSNKRTISSYQLVI